MTKPQQLADAFRRSIDGDAWHGPNLESLLTELTLAQAMWRPAKGLYSIAELTWHLHFWLQELRAVAGGRAYRNVSVEEQWPPKGAKQLLTNEAAWQDLVAAVVACSQSVGQQLAKLSAKEFTRPLEQRDYDLEFFLLGMLQHNAYHGGQISLLRKLQGI